MIGFIGDHDAFLGGSLLPTSIAGCTGIYRDARGDGTVSVLNATDTDTIKSIFLSDIRAAARQLERLRELGVRVTLDSFGGPGSSLSVLGEFPLDFVKLDRSLI